MAQPNLRIFFDGLEEAMPGTPCYDAVQPWYARVTVVNANTDTKWDPTLRALDPQKPTAKAGPFAVSFEVFVGATAALGSQYVNTYTVESLGAYPGDGDFVLGISMQLPKNITKSEFGKTHGFRFKADVYQSVAESNEDDNIFLWEKAEVPLLAPQWDEDDSSPFSRLKFVDFKAVLGSNREIDVLVKNQGSQTSLQLGLRLTIMGPPTPKSPSASVLETVNANSTAIPPGGSHWVRFKAATAFVQPRSGLSARSLKRLQTPESRRFRQAQTGSSRLAFGLKVPRYLVVDKDFDFIPLKPFFITLMNASHTEKVGFGELPVISQRPGKGGRIAIPQK